MSIVKYGFESDCPEKFKTSTSEVLVDTELYYLFDGLSFKQMQLSKGKYDNITAENINTHPRNINKEGSYIKC